MEFYANLFTRQEVLDPGPILEHVVERGTPEMNEALLKSYGLTAGFYQFHWETLGLGIIAAVLEFLNGGALPETINSTTIVLVSKVKTP